MASDSIALNSAGSRESLSDSDQRPSDWDEYVQPYDGTYFACHNQLLYYEKYFEKNGQWPPETGWNTDPPVLNENSEEEGSSTFIEKAQGIEINHEIQTVVASRRSRVKEMRSSYSPTHKRLRHHTGGSRSGSDKENLATLWARKSKRIREQDGAATLLKDAIKLLQKSISLSEEALKLMQTAASLRLEEERA